MADGMKAELDRLEGASKTWINDVAPALRNVAASIEELKYSSLQFGPLFILAWKNYSIAAAYIQDRLNEGAPAAEQIGTALYSAVVSLHEQQVEQKEGLEKLAGEMDFSI
ncbi:hypothetical protein LTT66_22150 [Nocardia gipuzkoensis]|uniref:hypothetical protein n=1 Tax=Nocardia gipuzkoensis TaxID=2749991 RepID=UPI001E4C21AC|nr:hypothetical protein [Nocardia gipuzkoensis]UGT66008.1 hypothetical protein LTT66_22150 [Nocardia gipuzkoensis]